MKRRITEISVYEFFMCMFVISIHLLSEGVDFFPKWSVSSVIFKTLTTLMTFAVPGFVFTSAVKLFYKYSEGRFKYGKFLLGRFLKIYVPYILAVTIYYIVFVYALSLDGYEKFDIKELLGFILSGNISAQFYFVVLIVQFYILMPFWIGISRIKSKAGLIALIAVSFGITALSRMFLPEIMTGAAKGLINLNVVHNVDLTELSKVFAGYTNKAFSSYMIFWVMGVYVGLNYDEFSEKITESRAVIYVGWFILAIAHCILSYVQLAGYIKYSYSPFMVIFFCLFSMLGFYIYSRDLTFSLEKMGKGFLMSIAGASYDIYLMHCLVITVVQYYLGHIEIENTLQRFFITAGITFGFSIIFCGITASFKENIKRGRKRKLTAKSRKIARRKRYL